MTRSLWGRLGALDALVVTSLIWFLAKFLRYAFPPLFGTFRAEFGLSNAAVGTAFTGMMLCYAAMQFPSGVLADRVGPVRVIAAGGAVAGGAALLVAATGAGGLPVLLAGMVLVGVGTGTHKTVAVMLLPAIYPDRRGRVLGALDTFGTFGGVVAPAVVVAVLGAALDWEWLFVGAGVAAAGFVVAFLRSVPRRLDSDALDRGGAAAADGGRPVVGYLALFGDRRFAAFVGVTVLFSFTYNGAVAFLPLYLTEETALSAGAAGLVYSGFFVVSLVQPLTGDAADRVGELPVIAAALALAAAGLALLVAVEAALPAAAAALLLGVGSHGFRPVRGSYLVSVIPDEVAGGTLGIVRTAIMGVGAVAPAVVGVVADRSGFAPAFGLLGAVLVAAVAAVLVLLSR
ncbi:MAG: MFS transporter [Halobacteriaceae archaeon]